MNKKILLAIGGIVLIASIALSLSKAIVKDKENLNDIDYRTDRLPIETRFQQLADFEKCFWKTGVIGSTDLGPTNYWIKGFLVFDKECFAELLLEYELYSTEVDFPSGISPLITGDRIFVWKESREFTHNIFQQSFAGKAYIDVDNRIVYIDVENA